MHEKQKLLSMIRKYDFVLYELQLYLDTHPSDQKAMEYFNHYARIKTQMEREFARDHYQLSGNAAESGNGICPAVRSAAAFADQR